MDRKQLLLDLYNAESSRAVFDVVSRYGLDGAEHWKPYGGNQNNAGTFENQQSSPENALVEKLTNSIDAILMKHCYVNGIEPKDRTNPVAPKNMTDAVEMFFDVKDGKWENASASVRNAAARNIQIILTDDRRTPNVAIFDNGEGQNPDNFPDTFLSIAHGNKNEIPFVQGKYNFGATGAVVFCGDTHRYQMIISRRNPVLQDGDGKIGFTLVRRHILSGQEENEVKLTWYEYLVLNDQIPRIDAEPMDLGLVNDALFEGGTIVKMYSYQLTKYSDATVDLWRELNPLLYMPAIPILIYEKRKLSGQTNVKLMLGNRTRLALDDRDKIAFRKDLQAFLFNSQIPISVYVFNRKTKNPEFIGGKSVIYTLNGQTQGFESKSFISQDLGLRNLREYMLVCVDCSQIRTTARQELFMASRDRLKQSHYYNELRNSIISLLKSDTDIRRMDQEYKGKVFKETDRDRDLVESLFSQLKSNKDIKNMLSGTNGSFSFFEKKTKRPDDRLRAGKKNKKKADEKILNRYPSVFRVKGCDETANEYIKSISRGGRGRITLETDVDNDFLSRSDDHGTLVITILNYVKQPDEGNQNNEDDHDSCKGRHNLPNEDQTKLNVKLAGPYNGEIQVYVEPQENTKVGEIVPLSLKMISSKGELEVIVYIKIEKEERLPNVPRKKGKKEPEMSLPQLTRVVKESPDGTQRTWDECGMTAYSIVKLLIGPEGAIEEIRINMDSNLVKKLVNVKGVNIEKVRNRYVSNIYAHALMIYTTMYGYYSRNDIDLDEHTIKDVQDSLNEAVEFSFKYYTNFLMVYEDFTD